MDPTTLKLVEFAASARYAQLQSSVVHECKRRLLDTLGCAIGAFNDPLVVNLRAMAREYSSSQKASLWGTSLFSSPEMATFCNGVMLRVQDFNDTYFASDGAHPSDIIAAVVAVAETLHADGRSVILATATGYEIFCRFMQSVDVGARNYDQTLYVTVATALAIGQLMRLSPAKLGHAVSLALAPHLALRQTRKGELSHWKGCAAAEAARNAVFAANLAARGVTGPSEIFEGKQGLWSVVGQFDWPDEAEWPAMTMIGRTYLKDLAVCYHAQAAAQAAIQLHPEVRGRGIESIEIASYEEAVRMIGSDPSRWAPKSRETADHSLPFIVAACLIHGAVNSCSFDDDRLADPKAVDLMRRTKVNASESLTSMYPHAAPARVTVRTSDGHSMVTEVQFPKGHSSDPMTDGEIERKFKTLCDSCGADAQAVEMAISTCWRIDTCADVASSIPPRLLAICGQSAGGWDHGDVNDRAIEAH